MSENKRLREVCIYAQLFGVSCFYEFSTATPNEERERVRDLIYCQFLSKSLEKYIQMKP